MRYVDVETEDSILGAGMGFRKQNLRDGCDVLRADNGGSSGYSVFR